MKSSGIPPVPMDALGPESAVPNGIRISRSVRLQSTIATGIQLF